MKITFSNKKIKNESRTEKKILNHEWIDIENIINFFDDFLNNNKNKVLADKIKNIFKYFNQ